MRKLRILLCLTAFSAPSDSGPFIISQNVGKRKKESINHHGHCKKKWAQQHFIIISFLPLNIYFASEFPINIICSFLSSNI